MIGLQRLLGGGLLVLVAATWKLWTPQTDFPQVPLLRAACDWPMWLDWCCLAVLIGSALLLIFKASPSVASGQSNPHWSWRRGASWGIVISLAGFFVLDQHRLQPWAWQFFLLATLLAWADDESARRGWRLLTVAIYFWSAVSKLDYEFCQNQGPAILRGLKQAMGLRLTSNSVTQMLDSLASVGMGLGELVVALLLAIPTLRWYGRWGATLMHLTLLAALGPLGLNHSAGVLLWNLFFLVQVWLLFSDPLVNKPITAEGASSTVRRWRRQAFTLPIGWRNRVGLGLICLAVVWPALEPFGYCDHWLAWSVYSAHADYSSLNISQEDLLDRADHIEPHAVRFMELELRRDLTTEYRYRPSLDLQSWSLGDLGVPVYPQARFQFGAILWVLERSQKMPFDVHVYESSMAWRYRNDWRPFTPDPQSDSRGRNLQPPHPLPVRRQDLVERMQTREELEAFADHFWFNARPRE